MRLTKKRISYIVFEIILTFFMTLMLVVSLGNNQFKLAIDNIIGNKIAIIQNMEKIATDYNSGHTITTIFPKNIDLNKLRKRNDVSFVSKSIPVYLEIETAEHKATRDAGTIKILGVDQNYFYDLIVEKVNISEGRAFVDKEISKDLRASMISKQYASEHGLKIGDSYTIESVIHEVGDSHKHVDVQTFLTVVGIFEPNAFSIIREDSDESRFNKEMINTSIYVSNETAKEIRNSLIKEEVTYFPNNFKGIKNPYGEILTSKSDMISALEKEENYEISIIPTKEANVPKLERDISKLLKKYPYTSLINASNRYDKLSIISIFSIPLLLLSLMLFILFNAYLFLKAIGKKWRIKDFVLLSAIEFLILCVGTSIGIVMTTYFRESYLFILQRYSDLVPKDYEVASYNRLDKVILTNQNILELMNVSTKEFIALYVLIIICCFTLSIVISKVLLHRYKSYRRLS